MRNPGVPISIFVADDHTIVLEGLVQLLQLHDDLLVVGHSAEGNESLHRIVELEPDVAVLDISMPGRNGIEITAALRELELDVAVVILSMHASLEYVLKALEVGAKAYLQKESAAAEIAQAIRAVHAGRRYLCARAAALVADQLSPASRKSPLQSLSARETEILRLVADGHSSSQIGALLNLSPKTVDTYRSRLMQKLGVADIVSLVKFAIRHGVVSLD